MKRPGIPHIARALWSSFCLFLFSSLSPFLLFLYKNFFGCQRFSFFLSINEVIFWRIFFSKFSLNFLYSSLFNVFFSFPNYFPLHSFFVLILGYFPLSRSFYPHFRFPSFSRSLCPHFGIFPPFMVFLSLFRVFHFSLL